MTREQPYTYIGLFEEDDPEPVKLFRRRDQDGQARDEVWTRPGQWSPSAALVERRLGHGDVDGEPRMVSEEDMQRWQQEFRDWWGSQPRA